jgi:hypothetical protein
MMSDKEGREREQDHKSKRSHWNWLCSSERICRPEQQGFGSINCGMPADTTLYAAGNVSILQRLYESMDSNKSSAKNKYPNMSQR